MTINNINQGSPLISQPINDNFTNLDNAIKNAIKENIGYGTRTGLVVSAQTIPNMTVSVSAGVAYLPSGERISINTTTLNIDNPSVVQHTGETHTTDASGIFTTDLKPITDPLGKYAGISNITVKLVSDNSIVTASSVDAANGIIDTALTTATAIKVDYYHGQKRIDIIIINSQGELEVVKGMPTDLTPIVPTIPNGAIKLAEINVIPKISLNIQSTDITNVSNVKGFYLDANYNLVVEQDLVVKGLQSIGNTVNEILIVRDNISNDQTGLPVKINDDLNVVGSIIIGGTVDGRDISTDGNVLDAHIVKQAISGTNTTKDKHVSDAMVKEWTDHVNATGNAHNMSHNQLLNIGQVDDLSTDITKDKHISNSIAKYWSDHVKSSHLILGETSSTAYRGDRGKISYDHAITTGNPHGTTHEQLSSVLGVSTASIDTSLTKHVSNALAKGWEDHKNATGNTHSMSHSQLNNIGVVDITSIDSILDKHISNALAKKWNDHVEASAPHIGHATSLELNNHTGNKNNPHNVLHNQTLPLAVDVTSTNTALDKHISDSLAKKWNDHVNSSHLTLGELSTTAYRGDLGAISYTHSQSSGNAHNTIHAQLSGILGVTLTSTNTVLDKHISDSLAKKWNDHVEASAPHIGHAPITHVGSGGNEHALVTTTAHGFMHYSDKIKLNGIETGATADMTATEILVALKTVDGSSSGLDADLLDGKNASDFADVGHTHDSRYFTESEINNLLANKLNTSSYTASDVLTKIKTVDGFGSGLDADLLDGKHYTSFVQAGNSGMKITVSVDAPSSPNTNDIWIGL